MSDFTLGIPQLKTAGRFFISPHDRAILRTLAAQVAELAARPIEQTKRDLWYAHNALQPTRPLIFCDPEHSWEEIIRDEDLMCEEPLARQWEYHLRRELFWGTQMQDDRVIVPFFELAHVYTETDWGLHAVRIGGHHGGAYTWEAPLKTYDDMDKLRFPEIIVDDAATEAMVMLAEETLGDLLTVRQKTIWWWTQGMTQVLVNLRGMMQIMYDMMDCPDDVHRLMAFLRDGHLAKLDFLEQNGLLSHNNDGTYVGSGAFGWSHELPQTDFTGTVRTIDMWGFAESQETVGISPEMFAEFVFPYQRPILDRFGLNCYGCCEPLHGRWHVVKDFPRLRRVSCSPWADIPLMAEYLTDQYILSIKPHPADLAMDTLDEDAIRAKLRRVMQQTRNCCVEFVMKDTHTIRGDPSRVIRWTRIAKEEAERL